MDISPKEIENIRVIGTLNGKDVKLIKTKGGLHIGVGKKSRNGKDSEPLAAGSHQGIVSFEIEKQFGADFKPSLLKSESEQTPKITDKTHNLSENEINNGVKLYVSQVNSDIDFILYKHGVTLWNGKSSIKNNQLQFVDMDSDRLAGLYKNSQVSNTLTQSIAETIKELKLEGVLSNNE